MQIQIKDSGLIAARVFKTLGTVKDLNACDGFIQGQRWNDDLVIRAAVSPHTTDNSAALAPRAGRDFVELIRPATILGRLTAARRYGFGVRSVQHTGGVTAHWVPEYAAVPLSVMSFEEQSGMSPRKVAALAVVTEELARMSGSENLLLADIGAAAVVALDSAFIDPTNEGVDNERPAAITYGQPSFPSAGTDESAVREDVRTLVRNYRGRLSTAVLIMNTTTAIAIAQMPAVLGGGSLNLATGTGSLFGLPVLISDVEPGDSNGSVLTLLDASAVQLSGLIDAELSSSREASIIMDTAPSAPAAMVSLFQCNCVGLMAQIVVNWRAARDDVAVTVTGVAYEV